jgi:hypothetical protein
MTKAEERDFATVVEILETTAVSAAFACRSALNQSGRRIDLRHVAAPLEGRGFSMYCHAAGVRVAPDRRHSRGPEGQLP